MYRSIWLGLVLSLVACGGDDGGPGPGTPDAPPGGTIDAPPGTPDARPVDAPPGACADLAGSWIISGACGADLCTITQSGCAITAVDCTSGAMSTSGTIDGNNFSYDGTSGGGLPATCSGTATGDTMSGTCTSAAGTCEFSGDRQ
jgi:hypothetical protein